jgi:hypothetical protein
MSSHRSQVVNIWESGGLAKNCDSILITCSMRWIIRNDLFTALMDYAEFLQVSIATIMDDNGIDGSSFRAWCGDLVFQTRSKLYNQEWHGLFSHIKVLYHFSWSGVVGGYETLPLVHTKTSKKINSGSHTTYMENTWISASKLSKHTHGDWYRNYFVPIITCCTRRVKSVWMRRRIVDSVGSHIKVYHHKYKSRPKPTHFPHRIGQTKRNKTKKNVFQSHDVEQLWKSPKIIGNP